jgi:ATP-dependent exoDNAse (exonuclease V) beta subunit
MKPIGHLMILASAGSGKTYALTNRFIRLLASGAAPERIVALTFTRKAAGEFFDEILNKLARAVSDEKQARQLAKEIQHPEFGPGDFLRLLRAMCDAMHRLNLGTLDSFFARIVRNFPLELGLSGDFTILDSYGVRPSEPRKKGWRAGWMSCSTPIRRSIGLRRKRRSGVGRNASGRKAPNGCEARHSAVSRLKHCGPSCPGPQ